MRRYGQNHLVDRGVLEAVVRQAAVRPDDVVLEVGAADGLLTRLLLERARLVHAFEVDARYAAPLEALAAVAPGLRVHLGDALQARLGELEPPPTALVANLAYNIAIPLIMTTLSETPTVTRWAVMVQKELGERLFAAPGTKAYAAVSVLTQLVCEPERARPVARSAFRPRPNVDSVFLTFTRRPRDPGGSWRVGAERLDAAGYAAAGALVRRAFARRRKQLVNSLAEGPAGAAGTGASDASGAAGPGGGRQATAAAREGIALARTGIARALEAAGASPSARPEELAPAQWVTFARALGVLLPS